MPTNSWFEWVSKSGLNARVPTRMRAAWAGLRASPIGYRLAKGAFWNLAGTAISRGLAIVASVCVARFLGRETYGQLGIIQSTVGMFGVVAGLGLGMSATKFIAEHRIQDPARAGRIMSNSFTLALVSGTIMALVLVMFAPRLAGHVLAAPTIAPLLRWGSLLVVLGALNAVQTGALSGLEAFKTIARVNLWSGLLSFPCLVVGAYLAGVTGAVWGLVASLAFNAVLNHQALRRETRRLGIKIGSGLNREGMQVLWSFSLPSLLSSVLGWATTWACAAILVNTSGGYGEMGITNATNQWRAALMFIPGLLTSTLLPVLAHERTVSSRNFGIALDYTHGFITWLLVPLAAMLMFAAGPILACYGSGFAAGRLALVYVLAGTAISSISSPIGSVIIAHGRMWGSFALTLANSAVYTACTVWLAESHGAVGLGLGYTAGHTVQAVAGIIWLRSGLSEELVLRNLAGIGVILGWAMIVG